MVNQGADSVTGKHPALRTLERIVTRFAPYVALQQFSKYV